MTISYLFRNRVAFDSLATEFLEKTQERAPGTNRLIERFWLHVRPRHSEPSVLELGPGSGYAAQAMIERGARVACIEFSPAMASVAASVAPSAVMVVDEFLQHDFGSEQYDVLVAIAFIHLFPESETANVLAKMSTLLPPGGLGLVCTTVHLQASEGYRPKTNFSEGPSRFRRNFTRKALERELVLAGFTIVEAFDDDDPEEEGKTWMNYVLTKS